MLLKPFTAKPPIEEETIAWIFEVFAWALRHLGAEIFVHHTILVAPTNAHFPGRASSPGEMAGLIFGHTLRYAGMQAWPVRLVAPGMAAPDEVPRIAPPSPLRLIDAEPVSRQSAAIPIGYDPQLVAHPEALIAGFAQVLAHHLGSAVREAPPGGIPSWPQTVEVLGVFLGFGVLFANTAVVHRPRSCASCSGPPADREVYLSQYDITYALALFCALKAVPDKAVLPPLRRSLRGHFKRCRRDAERRADAMAGLRSAMLQTAASETADQPTPGSIERKAQTRV